MSKKQKKGYFVQGHFVAYGSDLDTELNHRDLPSKTELKQQSHAMQKLGETLLNFNPNTLEPLALPEKLIDALQTARGIRDFEARRRQMQYVGKIMRDLDPEPIQQFLLEQEKGSPQERQNLHALEYWRERLLADEQALQVVLGIFPELSSQHLRALLRQVHKDQAKAAQNLTDETTFSTGRVHSRAYHELFQALKTAVQAADVHTAQRFFNHAQPT